MLVLWTSHACPLTRMCVCVCVFVCIFCASLFCCGEVPVQARMRVCAFSDSDVCVRPDSHVRACARLLWRVRVQFLSYLTRI